MAGHEGRPEAVGSNPVEDIKQIVWAPALIAADIDDEIVIMSIGKGHYFGLDDIGSEIWRRVEQKCSLSELVDSLTQDYDAPREIIEKEVVEFLRRMAEQDLVVLS